MANQPTITNPTDYSNPGVPFDLTGTSDGVIAEVRDDAGLLLPATQNPVPVSGGTYSIHVTGLQGSRGGTYLTAGGMVSSPANANLLPSSDPNTLTCFSLTGTDLGGGKIRVTGTGPISGAFLGLTVTGLTAGAQYTLSFKATANAGGAVARLTIGNDDPWAMLVSTVYWSSITSSAQLLAFPFTLPAGANGTVYIQVVNASADTGAIDITIEDVKLEVGGTATR